MSSSTPLLREKRDFYTEAMFEEAALRGHLRIPDMVHYTPVVLLPKDQCVFQTAGQVKHMLDLTFDPEVKELTVNTYGRPDKPQPKTLTCALAYNLRQIKLFKIAADYDTYWVDLDGEENNAVVVRSFKKKPNKAGKVLDRSDERDLDKELLSAEKRHPDFYQREANGAGLDERLAWLRREHARRKTAEAGNVEAVSGKGATAVESKAEDMAGEGKGKSKENVSMGRLG